MVVPVGTKIERVIGRKRTVGISALSFTVSGHGIDGCKLLEC